MPLDPKSLTKLVARRHPLYEQMSEHWHFLEETYQGGRAWFEKNLFRYYKEGSKEFKLRRRRAYRFPHTREVTNLVNKYVFKGEVKRAADAPQVLQDFWTNSTKNREDIGSFMRQVDIKNSVGGRCWIVVDSTSDGSLKTKAEAAADGDRVYAYAVPPWDALDMSFDELGELRWILIREISRDDADPINSTGKVGEQFRLWTRTDSTLITYANASGAGTSKKLVAAPPVEHGLGVVPVVWADCFNSADQVYCAQALINDIAYLDRSVANYLSCMDAIIQDQTFSQLAMPAAAGGSGGHEGETEENDRVKEVGINRVFTYDPTNGGKPEYISPDVKQAQLIIDAIKTIINEIYHSLGLAGERTKQDNSLGIDNSSGVAKAYDFERVNSLLVAKAKALEIAENRISALVLAYNGELDLSVGNWPATTYTTYPDTFDVAGLQDEMQVSQNLALLGAPKILQQEQMRRVAKKLLPDASTAVQAQIDEQIADWPADPTFMAAGVGTPPTASAPNLTAAVDGPPRSQ